MLSAGSDDEEDETAELMRELEKIKKERAEQREREVGLHIRSTGLKGTADVWITGARKGRPGHRATRARRRIRQSLVKPDKRL